jgi:uncharacterized protein YukJ
MPLKEYGVLRGSVIDHRLASGANAHFQLHVVDDASHYRIAVNVESQMRPSELEYLIDSNFQHEILDAVAALPAGWNALDEHKPGGAALDFIRGNLFNRDDMRRLPFDVPGPDNDLNEKLAHYVRRAMADEQAAVYAFGQRWGPEQQTDKIFGFRPGNGVHDIHMNQGNVGEFVRDDGVYQDGALLLHFPAQQQWVAIFLKFQSQTWHTDDTTGHQITDGEPDGTVRIIAALVNAVESPEAEFVTLLNTTPHAIDLAGWKLADRDKHSMALTGTVAAGETLRVRLTPPVVLPNRGGVITLLDASGLKVDGAAYTREQAAKPGTTIAF